MASVIPAFVSAMQDRLLRGNPREVYIWCHENLDVIEYRIVKHSVLETELGLRDSSIADAIARLVTRGYLDRGPRSGRLASYRLFYSRSGKAIPAQIGAEVASE